MGIVIPPFMKAIIGIVTSPTSRSNANPSRELYRIDTSWGIWYFFWTFLSRQGSSLNAQTYPFRISRRENDRPRRLSEEIKKDSKWKLTWTKAGTDLRNSWEDLWRLFESVTNYLMVCEFGYLNALKILNCDEERENNTLVSLYIRDWKRGGFYPAQSLKRNTVH